LSEAAARAGGTGRKRTLLSIQILRAVAALGVITHHAFHFAAAGAGHSIVPQDLVLGASGVDLFFVISGFVMVYASEPLFGEAFAPRLFFLRRLARIVPLYWAVTAVLLIYVWIVHRSLPEGFNSALGVIASFLFIPYPRTDGIMGPVHALGWTLNYEMAFYLVFALAILLPRVRAVAAITALFVLLTVIGRLFALPQPFAFWCDPIILEFCFGMMVALAYRAGVRLPRLGSWVLAAAAVAAFSPWLWYEPHVAWRALSWGVPGAALVAALVLVDDAREPGRIARAFAFLGDISYSIYLVHVLAFPIPRRLMEPWLSREPVAWIYAGVLVVSSVVAAAVFYLFFERPITRALQRRIGRPPPS